MTRLSTSTAHRQLRPQLAALVLAGLRLNLPHCKRELKKIAPRQKVCSAWKCRMAEIKARNERRRI